MYRNQTRSTGRIYKMKKLTILFAIALVFAFAGCGSSQEEAMPVPEEEPTAAEETTIAEETTVAPAQDIGVEKAKEIALKDAGFKEADVQFKKQSTDVEGGYNVYEIDFTLGETEYEYDIDAATGTIVDKSMDSIYDD